MGERPRRSRAAGAPHGRFSPGGDRSRTPIPSGQREYSTRVHHSVRQHQGAYRGTGSYPTPGHPVGLSFCVAPDVKPIPRSLTNIYKELTDDLGIPMPANGDLTPWTNQGVMLLNRCLTVEAGKPGSHQDKGWEIVTDAAIRALNNRRNPDGSAKPLVAILWGRKAQTLEPLLTNAFIISSPHPSPMSARYGFFGSKPFSRANQALIAAGEKPVNWSLPSA